MNQNNKLTMDKNISILGLGWLGLPLALELQKNGYNISGSTSRLSNVESFSQYRLHTCSIRIGLDAILGDWASFLNDSSVLIINFPPKRIENIETIHPAQIKQIIENTPKSIKVIFVSSTSVYQNTNGIVNESFNCNPEKASGVALVEAERLLRDYFGANLTILRLAGLIGPKRHPGRFLSNKRQLKNPESPVNLIHQKDVIGLIKKILELDCFGELINGCSDVHTNRKEFYEKAALELNLPVPVFETTSHESYKVVDNSKGKELLDFTYEFSDPTSIFKTES